MHVSGILRRFCPVVLLLTLLTLPAAGQLSKPRFGIGFNTLLSSDDGLGIGFRGRVSSAINADLSLAFDLGIAGYILNGRDDANYVSMPQVSLVVTMPGIERASYMLGGIGVYVNSSDRSNAMEGPTIHVGFGRVRALRESVLFYEINPALVVSKSDVGVVIPLRIGIIF